MRLVGRLPSVAGFGRPLTRMVSASGNGRKISYLTETPQSAIWPCQRLTSEKLNPSKTVTQFLFALHPVDLSALAPSCIREISTKLRFG